MTLPGTWLVFGQTSNFVNAQIGTTATMKEFYVFKFDGRLVDPKDNKTIVQTDDLIDSLRANAHVRFLTRPRPVTVGGAQGEVFDLEAVHAPACAYYNDGTSCWSLFPMVEGSPYSPTAMGEGGMLLIGPGSDPTIQAPVRFWVVKVHGQQMIIGWQDDEPTFDASVKDFEQILQTVRWSCPRQVARSDGGCPRARGVVHARAAARLAGRFVSESCPADLAPRDGRCRAHLRVPDGARAPCRK